MGKTALSLDLAARLDAEIVNADSMQVYRGMDIGTAKPTRAERSLVPHHLIDVADPDEPFDAARYAALARSAIEVLHGRGKAVLVVGGTGLYMKALEKGICPGAPAAPEVRDELLREALEHGLDALYRELLHVDPVLAGRIHPRDRQRIVRGLEVHRATGKPLSEWQDDHGFSQSLYRTVKIFLYRDRDELYGRIDRRVDAMMEQGFPDEVRRLLDMGYGPGLKSMQSLGYKQLVCAAQGLYALDAAVDEIKRKTRHYAKRQMTWFRADPEFLWVDAGLAGRDPLLASALLLGKM